MNDAKYVESIETLTFSKSGVEVYRVTTEDGEQIIGLPMFTSQKSGGALTRLNVTMLYVPQEQTVMNIVDVETTEGSMCTIEPSNKHLIQPEMQCFWDKYKERFIQTFNEKSEL